MTYLDVMHLSNGMIAVRSCSVFALVYDKVLCYRCISLLCTSTMSEKIVTWTKTHLYSYTLMTFC